MSTPDAAPDGYRSYSDADRAAALAALAANGGNVTRTAKLLNMPRKTLALWRDAQADQPADIVRLREEKKADLAERFENLVHKMLDILDEDVDGIKPQAAAVIAGISTEKMLLLRGDPTNITITGAADDERSAMLRERYASRPRLAPGAAPDPRPN